MQTKTTKKKMNKLMIFIGEKNTSKNLVASSETRIMQQILMQQQKKKRYSLHFNNSLPLLHFTNVIAWEVQPTRKSV